MKKSPQKISSTAQLAAHLGLSRWTVSRALNHHPGIGNSTRDRVFAAMSKAGFTPSLFARGLRGGRTGLVGVCVQELENLHLVGKLTALQNTLRSRGLRMLMETHDGEPAVEEEILRHLIAMRVEGVVLIASTQGANGKGLAELGATGIPYVLIDPFDPSASYSVSVDRAHAMRLAFEHLKNSGRRRVFALGIDPSAPYGSARAASLRAVAGTKMELDLLFDPDVPNMDFDYGHRLGRRLALRKWRKAGIIALNDRVALGAMRALLDCGREIPGEAAIIGYDNMAMGNFFRPALTTLDPQSELLISTASNLLCRAIEGKEITGEPVAIQARLVIRESA